MNLHTLSSSLPGGGFVICITDVINIHLVEIKQELSPIMDHLLNKRPSPNRCVRYSVISKIILCIYPLMINFCCSVQDAGLV